MIQRIQSLYLLLVAGLCATILFVDSAFYTESGMVANQNENIQIKVSYTATSVSLSEGNFTEEMSNSGMVYFIGAIGLLAFVTIFLYKNRNLQLKLTSIQIAMTLVLIGMMYMYSFGKSYTDVETQQAVLVGSFFPISIIILGVLAYMSIKKDENLVRSLDRLR